MMKKIVAPDILSAKDLRQKVSKSHKHYSEESQRYQAEYHRRRVILHLCVKVFIEPADDEKRIDGYPSDPEPEDPVDGASRYERIDHEEERHQYRNGIDHDHAGKL